MQSTRFKGMGYEVISTPEQEEGIRILGKETIDVVLVDPIDSPHAIQEFVERANDEFGVLPPLLVMTTQTFLPSAQRVIHSDYVEYMLKPIRDNVFHDAVNAAIAYNKRPKKEPSIQAAEIAPTTTVDEATAKAATSFILETFQTIEGRSSLLHEKIEQLTTIVKTQQQALQDLQVYQHQVHYFSKALAKAVREPTRQIYNALQFLRNHSTLNKDEPALGFLGPAEEGTHQMIQLIYSLTNLVNSLKQPKIVTVDCEQLIATVQQEIQPLTEEYQATIQYDSLPNINGDQQQLTTVFSQLLINGILYNRGEQPLITIRCVEEEHQWLFSIVDNGKGVAEENIERIFYPFYQQKQETGYTGNGVGLAICRNIIEKHNGRIWVASQLGLGSTFYFTVAKET